MLSPLYFDTLRDLIYENTGIVFDERKKYFVENRVREHMEELNITCSAFPAPQVKSLTALP